MCIAGKRKIKRIKEKGALNLRRGRRRGSFLREEKGIRVQRNRVKGNMGRESGRLGLYPHFTISIPYLAFTQSQSFVYSKM